jgi:hypothetical protein
VTSFAFLFKRTRVAVTLRWLVVQPGPVKQRDFTTYYRKSGSYPQRDLGHFNRYWMSEHIEGYLRYDHPNRIQVLHRYREPREAIRMIAWVGPSILDCAKSLSLDDLEAAYQFMESMLLKDESVVPWMLALKSTLDDFDITVLGSAARP